MMRLSPVCRGVCITDLHGTKGSKIVPDVEDVVAGIIHSSSATSIDTKLKALYISEIKKNYYSPYVIGYKYCSTCRIFISNRHNSGPFCGCCHTKMKIRPSHNARYNKQHKNKPGAKFWKAVRDAARIV